LTAGLAHEKVVTASILKAPQEIVVAFLQGLFDTDGTVDLRDGHPSLATSSPRLAREVHLLLVNLGVVARMRCKPTACRPAYILDIRGEEARRFMETVGFRLARKASRAFFRVGNPNLDLVPHVAPLVDSLVRLQTFPRAVHKRFYD
jgi:hypothetical protein